MAVRKRKPTSAGRRFQSVSDFSEITKSRPERTLVVPLPSSGGRNSYGRKTARHRGGGHKRQYRIIDFWRDKDGIPAKVAAIEYDPNRNAASPSCTTATARSATSCAPQRRRRRHAAVRARGRKSAPATRSRCATSRSARWCTTSSCAPAEAARSPAAPG